MKFGLSDHDQTKAKQAITSLWDICGNFCNNIFDDTTEEEIAKLKEEIKVLKQERIMHDK